MQIRNKDMYAQEERRLHKAGNLTDSIHIMCMSKYV